MEDPRSLVNLFFVNTFTDRPFTGSTAAVIFVDRDDEIPDQTKLKLSKELGAIETSFVSITGHSDKESSRNGFQNGKRFGLRWFTAVAEVPICGQGTLASAAALFESGNLNDELVFDTMSGQLMAKRMDDGRIRLSLPADRTHKLTNKDIDKFKDLIEASVGRLPYLDVHYSSMTKRLLIRLDDSVDRSRFESWTPQADKQVESSSNEVSGVIVTVKGREEYDFMFRYFAPWVGVAEDPVTGSSQTMLGPYWQTAILKNEFTALQCSPRTGKLWVTILPPSKDDSNERVAVAGAVRLLYTGHISPSTWTDYRRP